MVMSAPAVWMVVASTEGASLNDNSGFSVLGVALALLAPALGALYPFSFLFADKVVRSSDGGWARSDGERYDSVHLKLSVNVASAILGRSLVFLPAVAVATVEAHGNYGSTVLAFLGGAATACFLHSPADLLLRMANTVTAKREVLMLQYVSPCLAVCWLAAFVGLGIPRLELFVVGTILIVTVNVLVFSTSKP